MGSAVFGNDLPRALAKPMDPRPALSGANSCFRAYPGWGTALEMSLPQVAWEDLPGHVQRRILHHRVLFWDTTTIAKMRSVCRAWRRKLTSHFEILRKIHYWDTEEAGLPEIEEFADA